MVETLEALTAELTLSYWCSKISTGADYSTLDLLACLAHRQEPARLFVIGTYRPVEVTLQDHPLHDP